LNEIGKLKQMVDKMITKQNKRRKLNPSAQTQMSDGDGTNELHHSVKRIEISSVNLREGYITIISRENESVDLSKWKLFLEKDGKRFSFPDGTIIAPQGEIRVFCGVGNGAGRTFDNRNFWWNDNFQAVSRDEILSLIDQNQNVVTIFPATLLFN